MAKHWQASLKQFGKRGAQRAQRARINLDKIKKERLIPP